jgi:hypothetical protein
LRLNDGGGGGVHLVGPAGKQRGELGLLRVHMILDLAGPAGVEVGEEAKLPRP